MNKNRDYEYYRYKTTYVYNTITKIIDMLVDDYELEVPEEHRVDWINSNSYKRFKDIPSYKEIKDLFYNFKYDLDNAGESIEMIEDYVNHIYYQVYYGKMDYVDIIIQDLSSFEISDWISYNKLCS